MLHGLLVKQLEAVEGGPSYAELVVTESLQRLLRADHLLSKKLREGETPTLAGVEVSPRQGVQEPGERSRRACDAQHGGGTIRQPSPGLEIARWYRCCCPGSGSMATIATVPQEPGSMCNEPEIIEVRIGWT